jgi:ATP phosphoribosyltransferase
MKQLDIIVPDGSMQCVITDLLTRAGLTPIIEKKRTKQGRVDVPWIKRVIFQRPQEIPQYLDKGYFDIAIVGQDWIANWGLKFPTLLDLSVGRTGQRKPVKIVLAVKKESNIKSLNDLPKNCEIATEYIQLAQRYFIENSRPDIKVIPSYGNTEHKIEFGACGIIDVTESGTSLRENGLEVISEIMESNIVAVANPTALLDPDKKPFIDHFIRLINGAFQASNFVMLTANVPKKSLAEAVKIIGGLKGPTVSRLAIKDWFALQSVVSKEKEQELIFNLLQIGVTDILVNRAISLVMS